MAVVFAVVASVAFSLALATPAPSKQPGGYAVTAKGIGPLKLGMRLSNAKRALKRMRAGTLRAVHDTRLGGGAVYREFGYYRGLGRDSYTVGYLGSPGHFRLARIITYVGADKTSRGVHVGTPSRTLHKAYGGQMRCGQTIYTGRAAAYTPCRLGSPQQRHIVLLLSGGGQVSGNVTVVYPERVGRIYVQEPRLKVPLVG